MQNLSHIWHRIIRSLMSSNWTTIFLAGALLLMLVCFFRLPAFFDWAFERHQNILSWWVRPLMVLPFAAAAWCRSRNGILLALIALFSSMFWFPVPQTLNPLVTNFLETERDILKAGFTAENTLAALAVLLYGALLGCALWMHSVKLGLAVIVAGAVLKSLWSVIYSPDAGHLAVPIAAAGCLVVGAVFWAVRRFKP